MADEPKLEPGDSVALQVPLEKALREVRDILQLSRGTDSYTDSGQIISWLAEAGVDSEMRPDLLGEYPYILVPRQARDLWLYANESPLPFMVTVAGNIETFVYPRLRTLRIVAIGAGRETDVVRVELSSREYKYQSRLGIADVIATIEVVGITTIDTVTALDHIVQTVSVDTKERGNSVDAGITTTGASQIALAANANRKYLFIQNPTTSGGTLWIQFNGAAVQAAPSIELKPGDSYESNPSFIEAGQVQVIHPVVGVPIVVREA